MSEYTVFIVSILNKAHFGDKEWHRIIKVCIKTKNMSIDELEFFREKDISDKIVNLMPLHCRSLMGEILNVEIIFEAEIDSIDKRE